MNSSGPPARLIGRASGAKLVRRKMKRKEISAVRRRTETGARKT
jgi:hypothetical protein